MGLAITALSLVPRPPADTQCYRLKSRRVFASGGTRIHIATAEAGPGGGRDRPGSVGGIVRVHSRTGGGGADALRSFSHGGHLTKAVIVSCVLLASMGASAYAENCAGLPNEADLRSAMNASASATAGGLFNGARMWAAVVNRDGELCAYVTSTVDPTRVWPGSQAIAKAKAYTANAFSLSTFALSTAILYTFTQPGHSLNSLGQSNLFDSSLLAPPDGTSGGRNQIAGGLIFFGGGVPLYKTTPNGKVIIGGLGISSDTSCTDHEIAKRVRNVLNLNPAGGATADDIVYSPPDPPSVFAHPVCLNTYRNGTFIGNEAPATYPFVPPAP